MNSHINKYKSKGFNSIKENTSCIAGEILTDGHIVVKFGQDPAYHEYIDFIQNIAPKLNCWPVIHLHSLPLGSFKLSNEPYTVTEMEVLQPLSSTDKESYEVWIDENIKLIASPSGARSDPFNLEKGLKLLIQNARSHKVGLDFTKGDNIMIRNSSEYVITDPYF